jgi:hypothetical protein
MQVSRHHHAGVGPYAIKISSVCARARALLRQHKIQDAGQQRRRRSEQIEKRVRVHNSVTLPPAEECDLHPGPVEDSNTIEDCTGLQDWIKVQEIRLRAEARNVPYQTV